MSKAITTTKLDITTPQQAMDYLKHMHNAGLLYHLDDDPRECLGKHGLTEAQYSAIDHNVKQLHDIDWAGMDYVDVHSYIVRELV